MPSTFYITTAIDYTNSPPHIGHTYEKVLADVVARYHRLKGERVFYLTGVDQHGQKVQQSAAKAGVAPAEFVKRITQGYLDLWKKLDIKYDGWAETTAPIHKKVVQGMIQRLWDEKDPKTGKSRHIYKAKQSGYYSVRQEQFLTDKERGPDGEFGPEWGQVEFREEENYYFKLEQHKQWLLDLIDKRAKTEKPVVIPDFRERELRNAVEKVSGDLCISRPKSRLDWGIELPFDKDFVTYVWFDALSNYISFADYDPSASTFNLQPSSFLEKWPALQIIGKDILVPAHGIYWLIMLHALGFPDEAMPQLLVHGWWNMSGAKMSKSLGNIVDPGASAEEKKPRLRVSLEKYNAEQIKKKREPLSENQIQEIIERCSPEALRYYLVSDIFTGQDANFDEERLADLYNNDLANGLGNLLSRALSMTNKYQQGRLNGSLAKDPSFPEADSWWSSAHLAAQLRSISGLAKIIRHDSSQVQARFEVEYYIGRVNALIKLCNELVEIAAPWKLAKNSSRAQELSIVLYSLAESLRIIAILLSPVLPNAAHGIFDQLNWKTDLIGKEERFRLADTKWGGLLDGHVVGKPVPLFPRI